MRSGTARSAFPLWPVLLVEQHHGGLVFGRFLRIKVGVRRDDYLVTGLHQTRRRAVHHHLALFLAADDVRGETLAVVDIINLYALMQQQAGGLAQLGRESDGAFVIKIGGRDGRAVEFGFQEGEAHGG